MPKLPLKKQSAEDTTSFSSYIPTQMVDYTSLPPIEEDTAMTRFKRLPLIVRIGAVLLPVLLLAGVGVGVWQLVFAPPPIEAEAPPAPTLSIVDARVVSADAIVVDAQLENAEGMTVTGQLLDATGPIAWADAAASADTVQNGSVTVRIAKVAEGAPALDRNGSYQVELKLGDVPDAPVASAPLTVPDKLADTFFGVEVAQAPTPEPTPQPTPEPTPAPTPQPTPEPAVLIVAIDSTLLISPTLGTEAVGTAELGASFEPLLRSADSQWFLVQQGEAVGWINSDQIKISPATRDGTPLVTPDEALVTAGPLTASVFNGGNIRYWPDTATGTVLGQLHAGQTITLLERSPDGEWLKVIAPEASGWVSITLLTLEDDAIAQLPESTTPPVVGRNGPAAMPPATGSSGAQP